MNDIIIHALAERIKVGMLTLEELPELFRDPVARNLEEDAKQ